MCSHNSSIYNEWWLSVIKRFGHFMRMGLSGKLSKHLWESIHFLWIFFSRTQYRNLLCESRTHCMPIDRSLNEIHHSLYMGELCRSSCRNFQWARCFKFNKHIEVIQFSYFNCSDRTVLGGRECDGLDFQTKKWNSPEAANCLHRNNPKQSTKLLFFSEQKPIPHTPGALFYTHVHFHLTHVSLCLLEHIRLFSEEDKPLFF